MTVGTICPGSWRILYSTRTVYSTSYFGLDCWDSGIWDFGTIGRQGSVVGYMYRRITHACVYAYSSLHHPAKSEVSFTKSTDAVLTRYPRLSPTPPLHSPPPDTRPGITVPGHGDVIDKWRLLRS